MSLTRDLKSPFAIITKGILFVILGLLASALLAATIFGFCRFYYFAFYVIEKYVDSQFRYAGLLDFLSYLLRRNSQ